MSVVADILESWRRPSVVMRRHMMRGRSEPFAFTFLVVFLVICLIAQWPEAARTTAMNPDIPLPPQLLGRAMALLATIPLWYAFAALGGIVLRTLGGQGMWYEARIALFWALVTVSPMILLTGLVAGMIGPGPQLTSVGLLTFGLFGLFWALNLREAGRRHEV